MLRIAEATERLNARVSKMSLESAIKFLQNEINKPITVNNASLIQYAKELLFLLNNKMQAPTAIHIRAEFRKQLAVCKKVYKNSLIPLPRIDMWNVKQGPLFKEISSPRVSGKANIYLTKANRTDGRIR